MNGTTPILSCYHGTLQSYPVSQFTANECNQTVYQTQTFSLMNTDRNNIPVFDESLLLTHEGKYEEMVRRYQTTVLEGLPKGKTSDYIITCFVP